MANDVTLPGTGAVISTDSITSLNGGAPTTSGEQVQRVKLAFGSPASATDVTATAGLPVASGPNLIAGPTAITASDAVVGAPVGDGTPISGASTAGSIISLALNPAYEAWTIWISNYNNGTIYFEASTDSTNGTNGTWVELKGRRTGTAVGIESVDYKATSNGYYRGSGAGFTYLRARFIGVSTFPTVQILSSLGTGAVFLNSGIPAGSSAIGSVSVRGLAITGTSGSIAAAGTGTVGPLDVSAAGNVSFVIKNTVAASPYAGAPVLVFEQSDDNTSWGALPVTRSDTGATATTLTLGANTANGELVLNAAMQGGNYARVRVTTGPTTNAMTIAIVPGGLPFAPSVSIANAGAKGGASSIPVVPAFDNVTGNITTQNLALSGVATAGSVVAINTQGASTLSIQVTGAFTGALTPYATLDGVNWFAIGSATTLYAPTSGLFSSTIPSNGFGIWTMDASGFAQIRITAASAVTGTAVLVLQTSTAGTMVAVDTSLPPGTNNLGNVGGLGASLAATSGNPVRVAGVSRTALQATPYSNNQTAEIMLDNQGRVITAPFQYRAMTNWTGTTIAVATATTIVAAQGAAIYADITSLTISNSSATAIQVTISDGTHSFIVQVPAGGGIVQNFPVALRATTANVAWTATANAAVTSYYVMAVFVQNS